MTCAAVFDMDAKMGDLRPDLKFAPPSALYDVPSWAKSTRQIQGRLCPDDPLFGIVVGRLGVYGASMPVHPHLRVFSRDIEIGSRFTDDEPVPVIEPDGSEGVRQLFRAGFKHMDGDFEAQAAARRRQGGIRVSQDAGYIDANDPHRLILNVRFVPDETGVWTVGSAHPSSTFGDYRRAIGMDWSGDYEGEMVNGQPKWRVGWVSVVKYGATANKPLAAAASADGKLWAFGAYDDADPVDKPADCKCDTTPPALPDESGIDELATVKAELDALHAQRTSDAVAAAQAVLTA